MTNDNGTNQAVGEDGIEVIAGPRQSGKTTEAIKLANEQGAYLAVHNRKRATQVYHADGYPDLDRFPITYRELCNSEPMPRNMKVVIDDLDMFLRSEVYPNITGVSTTATDTTTLDTFD